MSQIKEDGAVVNILSKSKPDDRGYIKPFKSLNHDAHGISLAREICYKAFKPK